MDQLQFIEARWLSRSLVEWLWAHYELLDGQSQKAVCGQEKVYWKYLAQQTKALIDYKKQAEEAGMLPDGDFTSQKVEIQVECCFHGHASFWEAYCDLGVGTQVTFFWTGPWGYMVRCQKQPKIG